MSWRGRDDGRNARWGDDREQRDNPRGSRDREREREHRWGRQRSPVAVWERDRRSPERHRRPERYHRDIRDTRDSRDRYEHRERDNRERPRDNRRRERDRSLKQDYDVPAPPSPPKISMNRSKSRSKSMSIDKEDCTESQIIEYDTERPTDYERDRKDGDREEAPSAVTMSPGDWFCTCGSYNFKRRQVCYRRNCDGKRSEGTVYSEGDTYRSLNETPGITKKLLFRRLDALTTEEKILDEIKERCSKAVLDSIAGITIGREPLTGASKCLAYINFNSIADSTAALTELLALDPPLNIANRDVLISYYNEPQKMPKPTPAATEYNNDYSNYYSQMGYTNKNMSEADRVNAAAAVAQSAISAAQARNFSWAPTAATGQSTTQTATVQVPTGDGKTVYTAPDVRTFLYDETSGYYYDPSTGLYYDGKTQYFFNSQTNQYMYWEATSCTYIAASQAQQSEQEQIANTKAENQITSITTQPEERKKKKDDQVKVAKKIAKDMERWARTLNQKKENAKSNVVMEQPRDVAASKGSVDIGFSVLRAGPSLAQTVVPVKEYSPPRQVIKPQVPEEFLNKNTETEHDTDEGIIDWGKLTCLLCKRKFPSPDVLIKHKSLSDLHKQNLEEFRKKQALQPQNNGYGYRDRAAERRMKFGEDEPIVNKRYVPPEPIAQTMSAPPPSVVDTIGGKMLQKMGWAEGTGLGKTGQGRTAPIEAEQRPALVGLGQKKGIYTPTPGETYRDTVKKLMIARYKEVVADDDD